MSTIQPPFNCGRTTAKFSPQLTGFVLVSLAIHLTLILSNQERIKPDSGGGTALRVQIITPLSETVTAPISSRLIPQTPSTVQPKTEPIPQTPSTIQPKTKPIPQTPSTVQPKTEHIPKLVELKKSASQTVSAREPISPQQQITGKEEAAEKNITPEESVATETVQQTLPPPPALSKTTFVTTPTRDRQAIAERNRAIALERSALAHHLQQALTRHFNYPLLARRRGWQGEVLVSFTLESNGKIAEIHIARGSGHKLLDRAALTILSKIGRIEGAPQYSHTFELPIIYRLQDG